MNRKQIKMGPSGDDENLAQQGFDAHVEEDPYGAGLVSRQLRIWKGPVKGRSIAILTNLARGRELRLIDPPSRVVRANDVHELSCTSENRRPGEVVQDVGYLAFAVFDQSGVLASGDTLEVDGSYFGTVLGFNQVHSPNHLNIVVGVESLTTGLRAGWQLQDPLVFRRPAIDQQPR